MPRSAVRAVLCDTCFWIAALDPREPDHGRAAAMLDNLRGHTILVPWPVLYEVIGTRLVKRPMMAARFERVLSSKSLRIDDTPYRESCLERLLADAGTRRNTLSLADRVLRELMLDGTFRITRLLTFNPRDFADVCRDRGISLWPA